MPGFSFRHWLTIIAVRPLPASLWIRILNSDQSDHNGGGNQYCRRHDDLLELLRWRTLLPEAFTGSAMEFSCLSCSPYA